ncbi:hypothetical protein LCGC14_1586850 [marine sediment metagenome]|uniref:Uncharacterized protein n=1 Tax=marine sediment metagenome TaxID=412755 RepID=A0A0F9J1B6_9ZZZZ
MTHYGIDPELQIWYLLVNKKTDEVISCDLLSPDQAREYNETNRENDSDLVWVKDPASP